MSIIESLEGDILALSLDGKSTPSLKITVPEKNSSSHALGWGLAWYPHDQMSAMVTKDPSARGEQVFVDAVTDWSNFRSTVFFCKICGANEGYNYAQSQPFSRSFAGRDWLFTHNGYLDKSALELLHGSQSRLLEPLGNTDSELAFCHLLSQIQVGSARKISDIDPHLLHSWFLRFDTLGSADMSFTDGESIVCFHGAKSPKSLYFARIQPPHNQTIYQTSIADITLNDPRDTYRTMLVISSTPFSQGQWQQMAPNQLLIIRRGKIVWDSCNDNVFADNKTHTDKRAIAEVDQKKLTKKIHRATTTKKESVKSMPACLYEVSHTTLYDYTSPVEHSTHSLRLQPINDQGQEVISSELLISSPAEEIRFEDVFGNQVTHCTINAPYSQLTIEAKSLVKVYAVLPDDLSNACRQTSIPLIWMPWQRQMMMPYLLPPELPESELTELTDYAMSFVERNEYHLLNTIKDINLSIFRDFKYVSNTTSNSTTPFTVYTLRHGVCQDFANLFICLARLLGIPARYRMGYIYTGENEVNKVQSDASHAWLEVYLPYVGWRGFDPTNGCVVNQDHMRVACGRNYRDATPTAGTIFKGGSAERMSVKVKMIKRVN